MTRGCSVAVPAPRSRRSVSTRTDEKTAARNQNGARMPRASAVTAARSGPRTKPATSNEASAAEVGADVFGVAGDHDPANGGPDDAAPEAEQESGQEERPELRRDRTGDHRESGDDDTAAHHERDVAAVGVAGEEELGEEPGEEARGDDESELGAGEAEPVAQVGEQRVDRAVAERHAPGRCSRGAGRESGSSRAQYEVADRPARSHTGMTFPPSTQITCPFTRSASADAKKTAVPTMCSASVLRRMDDIDANIGW